MYKWPQGRVIRMICLLATLAIAADLGYDAYNRFDVYLNPGTDLVPWQTLAIAIIAGVLALGALIGGIVAIGFLPKSVDFLIEVEQEMVRVTWPTTRVLIQSTAWIAIMVVVLSIGIFLVDGLNYNLLAYIFGDSK